MPWHEPADPASNRDAPGWGAEPVLGFGVGLGGRRRRIGHFPNGVSNMAQDKATAKSDDQPRDDDGRFTEKDVAAPSSGKAGGGSTSSQSESKSSGGTAAGSKDENAKSSSASATTAKSKSSDSKSSGGANGGSKDDKMKSSGNARSGDGAGKASNDTSADKRAKSR